MDTQQPHVLLVEDNPQDLRLTQEAFHDADPSIILDTVADGREALAFLRREGDYVNAARPKLILLDLSLRGVHGREVLKGIKTDASLRNIPTIILSMSQEKSDIEKSYGLQANCYLSKPEHYDGFASMIKGVIDFWLIRAKLPS
jgi:two-component system, chemotaxis family, response regulator Rcp1